MRVAVVEHQTVRPFEIIRQATQAGHEAVFVTCDLGLYLKGMQVHETDLRLAEEVVTVEATTDPGQLVAALGPLARQRPLDAVLTASEQHTPAVAEAAARLGLPHTDIEAVRLTRDKSAARRRLAAAGIPQPRFHLAASAEESADAADEIGYPVVVKPVDGSASVNVSVARTRAEVLARAAAVRELTGYGRAARAARLVLVEEFMRGPVVSCETLSAGGRHLVLGITDRIVTPLPHQVELGGSFPVEIDLGDAVAEMCLAALDALGFDLGAAHTEFVLTRQGPRIVEVNGRLAGGPMPLVIGAALRRPIYADLLEVFARRRLPEVTEPARGAGIRSLVVRSSGRLESIEESPYRDDPGVVDYEIRRRIGDPVRPPQNNRDRCGSVIAVGNTTREASALAEKVASTTRLNVRRDHVLLVDRGGYRKFRDGEGRPFLDQSRYEVSVITTPDKAHEATGDEIREVVAVDVEDEERLLKAAKAVAATRPVDRIVAVPERLLLPAARLRRRLGVPGMVEEQATLIRDKVAMKRHMRRHGIAVPEFAEVGSPEEVLSFLDEHGATVLKPVLAMGSRGVHVLRSARDLDASMFELEERRMVEEFVDGPLFHIDSLVSRGEVVVANAHRYLSRSTSHRTSQPVCAVQEPNGPALDTLLAFNGRTLRTLPWLSGVSHNEVFLNGAGEPVLCEIAGRPGGGGVSPSFRHLHGVSLYEAAVLAQLGEDIPRPAPRRSDDRDLTAWATLYAPPGVIERIDLPEGEWILEARIRHQPGTTVGPPKMSGDGTVFLTVYGPDRDTVLQRLDDAVAQTRILVSPLPRPQDRTELESL